MDGAQCARPPPEACAKDAGPHATPHHSHVAHRLCACYAGQRARAAWAVPAYPSFPLIYPSFPLIYPSFLLAYPSFRLVYPSFPLVYPSFPLVYPSFPLVYPSFPLAYPSFPLVLTPPRSKPISILYIYSRHRRHAPAPLSSIRSLSASSCSSYSCLNCHEDPLLPPTIGVDPGRLPPPALTLLPPTCTHFSPTPPCSMSFPPDSVRRTCPPLVSAPPPATLPLSLLVSAPPLSCRSSFNRRCPCLLPPFNYPWPRPVQHTCMRDERCGVPSRTRGQGFTTHACCTESCRAGARVPSGSFLAQSIVWRPSAQSATP
jgi:hypothetical protein